MEQKTSTLNYSLKWGVIIGIVLVIYTLLLYVFDLSLNRALGWIANIIMLIAVFLIVKNYRDKINNGLISFGNAFSVSFLTMLFSGIISAIFAYLLYNYIAPELIDKLVAFQEEKLLSRGIPEDMIEAQINMGRKFMSPGFIALFALGGTIIFGAIISLIIALILKKENKTPFSQPV
jgi:hypothetical protein